MTISTHAAAAKAIRAELKKNGIAATVRAKSYAGGSSVDVDLTNDELPATVKAVSEFCDRFQMGDFNGMEDIYEYRRDAGDLPQVKFVFVNCHYSAEIRQEAWDFARNYWAGMEDAPESAKDAFHFCNDMLREHGDMIINRTLRDTDAGSFWSTRKPRLTA